MSPITTGTKQAAVTIGEFMDYVLAGLGGAVPFWPPDVFGVATALLHKSGAYGFVLDGWAPSLPAGKTWQGYVREISQQWRIALTTPNGCVPGEIAALWAVLTTFRSTEIQNIRGNQNLCETLLKLCAISDETCWGFGIPESKQLEKVRNLVQEKEETTKRLARMTRKWLRGGTSRWAGAGSTLCQTIHPSRLRVLPKLHIPQAGFTIRSFSRNLALCTGDEIRPSWNLIRGPGEESMNLLLIPWPKEVRPAQFGAAAGRTAIGEERHGLFVWKPEKDGPAKERITAILDRAELIAGPVAGVVLPEMALTKDQYESVHDQLLERAWFAVAGITEEGTGGAAGKNYLRFEMRLSDESDGGTTSAPQATPNATPGKPLRFSVQQSKHHRWLLDKSQILQYGLGSILSPRRSWWEDLAIQDRALHFFAIRDWLTMSVLICEDLARPDPVGDLVRAVGPNLVIALLMDGPQLASRWAGRYATVLADDPGCSVLSLTSAGMCRMSRPPHVKSGSRVVALWKDAKSGSPVEIELPEGADAIVLSLTVNYMEEWTADGRTDAGTTGYPVLGGIHPVFADAASL